MLVLLVLVTSIKIKNKLIMKMNLKTMWATIIMLLTMSSCTVNCNSTTCTGYVTDTSGNQYELRISKQYINTDIDNAKADFMSEFKGGSYALVDRDEYQLLNSCKCLCD